MTAARNRAQMPTVAAWVDEWRKFSPSLTVIYAREGKHELRTMPDYSRAFTIPANYFPCAEYGKKGEK